MRTRWRLLLCTRPAPVGALRRQNLPVCIPPASRPCWHSCCSTAVQPPDLSLHTCCCCDRRDSSTDLIAITQPTTICRSAPLGVKFSSVTVQSALLLLAASSPGCLGWSLALAFLPVISAVPQPWYYALHVHKRGYAVFSSWDLCSGHGAIGGSGAIHKLPRRRYRIRHLTRAASDNTAARRLVPSLTSVQTCTSTSHTRRRRSIPTHFRSTAPHLRHPLVTPIADHLFSVRDAFRPA